MVEPNNPPLFSGHFRHGMDEKYRVTVPSRWRRGDSDAFYLLPSQDNQYLSAMPPAEFARVNDLVNSDPRISPADRRSFVRFYFSRAQHCTVDRQGRLLLPEEFRKLVGLNGNAVLVGAYDRFEIWSPERWDAALSEGGSKYQEVATLIGL